MIALGYVQLPKSKMGRDVGTCRHGNKIYASRYEIHMRYLKLYIKRLVLLNQSDNIALAGGMLTCAITRKIRPDRGGTSVVGA